MAPPGARFHGTLPHLGSPVHIAEYAWGAKVCAYSVREDPTIGQDAHRKYLTWQWDPETGDWRQFALPDQIRPIYRPENLEAHPDWPVYVFDREDMVDEFHQLSGEAEVLATTVPGGPSNFEMGDWGPLEGRAAVTLWPSNHEDSIGAMHQLGRRLQKADAKVSIMALPQELGKNFSFIHITQAGWTWPQVEAFISNNRRTVDAAIVPIRTARVRANGGAPPVTDPPADPRKAKQSPVQVRSFRDAWEKIPGLAFAPNGTPYSHVFNIVCTFAQAKPDIWFDEFHHRIMHDSQNPRFWLDTDTTELTCKLQGSYGFSGCRSESVWEAVTAYAKRFPRHEVRDWLRSLKWDCGVRLSLMLPVGYGTAKLPYFTAVGRCFLMGAVARVMYPGCQVDYVPVFEGAGGVGKTSSLRVLFGKWFDNPTSMMGEKDFLQNMNGKWCLELGEMANIPKRALEVVKSCITRTTDSYRASFGRSPGDYPRQCVFAGTIDRDDWNSDEAGGRRWWPVKCGEINLGWLRDNREQLFAEALARVEAHEPWHNVSVADAKVEQALRRPGEGWAPVIHRFLAHQTEVSMESVMRIALEFDKAKDWKPADLQRAAAALKRLGWTSSDGGAQWHAPES